MRVTEGMELLSREYAGDAGLDALLTEDVTVRSGEVAKIPLGIRLELEEEETAFVLSRSGSALDGLLCQPVPIDSGYTGEVHAIVQNVSSEDITLRSGERPFQIVTFRIVAPDLEGRGARGERGFGDWRKG